MIYYNSHHISKSDIAAVTKTLKFGKISKGQILDKFEKNLKTFFNCRYCLVVSSGTAAQIVLAKSLNWKKNDNIILSPLTFVSGSNSIALSGANPIFVDKKKNGYSLDPLLVKKKILELKKKKQKVKAIMCTDYAGLPSDWNEIKKIAKKFNIKLINDNCHSLGSTYFGKIDYAIKYADYIIQSFHAVKNITTGEGGALLTNDKKIYERAKSFREHGFKNPKKNFAPWDYDIINGPGFNCRLSDINCALGNNQLIRVKKIINKKRIIAKIYDNFFKNFNFFKILKSSKDQYCSYHLYPLSINFKKLKISQFKFYNKMKKTYKIQLQKHYIPSYRFSFFKKKYKVRISNFENTENLYNTTFSLPIYQDLKKKQVNYICKSILKALKVN
ncbi:MAG: dTDP-4-amino-4,6-dideoxygalactose transaminase [Pelagibacterales bacterium]|nr:dTDP-4-amino-4,6-dideoxygalactose transaminase [Pelagibacterales bacterium]